MKDNLAFDLLRHAAAGAIAAACNKNLTDADVHAARKALKKARAAIRLLRPRLADDDYAFANKSLRDAGRQLAKLRDAYTLLDAINRRVDGDESDAESIQKLRSSLSRSLTTQRDVFTNADNQGKFKLAVDSTIERLRYAEYNADDSGDFFIQALEDIYRKARKAFRHARTDRTTLALHEWRKQIKYLRNTVAIFCTEKTNTLQQIHKHASFIAASLGEDHDLASVQKLLTANPSAKNKLLRKIGKKRQRFQKQALARGALLLAVKPKKAFDRDELRQNLS
jgi:CHAD domain-containing protein